MDCTVILVSFNTREVLLRSLKELHGDTSGRSLEVIVVDNASEDGSAEATATAFPSVRRIENSENVGFARAVNQALREAVGRHVLLLNPDAFVEPSTIARLLDVLDSSPSIGAVGPIVVSPDGTSQHHCASRELSLAGQLGWHFRLPFTRLHLGEQVGPHGARATERLSGAALAVRRDVIETVGFLDERFFLYYEDADWVIRIREAGFAVACVTEARVTHLLGASSQKDPVSCSMHAIDSELLYFEKHKGRLQTLVLSIGILVSTGLRAISLDAFRALRSWDRQRLRADLQAMKSCLSR